MKTKAMEINGKIRKTIKKQTKAIKQKSLRVFVFAQSKSIKVNKLQKQNKCKQKQKI